MWMVYAVGFIVFNLHFALFFNHHEYFIEQWCCHVYSTDKSRWWAWNHGHQQLRWRSIRRWWLWWGGTKSYCFIIYDTGQCCTDFHSILWICHQINMQFCVPYFKFIQVATNPITSPETTTPERTTVPIVTTPSTTLPVTIAQTTTTEFVEPENVNNAPVIKARLAKLAVTAGKPFNHIVPLDTFYDAEDGTNLKLELLDKHERPLESKSWIQFNAETRNIYGL